MNNKKCIEDLKNGDLYDEKGFVSEHGYAVLFHAEAHHEIFREDWIPIEYRPGTEEEYAEFSKYGSCPRSEFKVYTNKMPEDGQSVLITTKWGTVCEDIFHDDVDSVYFEDHDDPDVVIAWMPKPKEYVPEVDNEDS